MKRKGFTLIELLIVIGVIGLLATIIVASVNGARVKSRDSKRVSDLSQIKKALELGFEPGSGYPVTGSAITLGSATTDVLCALGTTVAFVADQLSANCDVGRVFMGLVPANPTPGGADYAYKSTDGSGSVCSTAPCLGFCVQTSLEKGVSQSGFSAGNVIADEKSIKNGTCP